MKSNKTSKSDIAQLAWISEPDTVEIPAADVVRDVLPDVLLSQYGYRRTKHVPNDIHIERLIMHKLDHWEKTKDLADDLTAYNDDGRKLLVDHIKKVIRESQWDAHFKREDGDVCTLCSQLLGATDAFIESSKQLAVRLYDSMTTRVIPRGDFVAAVYRHDEETLRRIAIFKLDMETRQVRDVDHVGNKTRINIEKNDGVLPTPQTKNLTKCALLTPIDIIDLEGSPATRFYIQLLDAQAGPRSPGVAMYFYEGFLEAVLEPNARRHTHEFLRVTGEFISAQESAVTSEDREEFYDARREVLAIALESDDPEIDIDQFVKEALPNHENLQTQLASELARVTSPTSAPTEQSARTFSVDADVASPFVRKVILEVDHAGRLIFSSPQAYQDMVKIERDGDESLYRIVIKTHTYRQVEH